MKSVQPWSKVDSQSWSFPVKMKQAYFCHPAFALGKGSLSPSGGYKIASSVFQCMVEKNNRCYIPFSPFFFYNSSRKRMCRRFFDSKFRWCENGLTPNILFHAESHRTGVYCFCAGRCRGRKAVYNYGMFTWTKNCRTAADCKHHPRDLGGENGRVASSSFKMGNGSFT